jgi:hypothetical protein
MWRSQRTDQCARQYTDVARRKYSQKSMSRMSSDPSRSQAQRSFILKHAFWHDPELIGCRSASAWS